MNPSAGTGRFLAAVAVSLMLHIALLSGTWLRMPEPSAPALRPLEARLLAVPPAILPAPPPKPPPRARRIPPPATAPPPPAASEAAPLALPVPEPAAIPAESAEAAAPAVPAPVVAETAPATTTAAPAPEPAPVPVANGALPRKGRIVYTLYLGADNFSVGRVVQSWEIEGDGYKLGSVAETTGLADLFRAQRLNYLSAGKVTAHGLRPETFLMSRTRRGKTEAAQARFDWDSAQLLLGRAPAQRAETLTAGSQDFVSFMYQFAFAPPAPGRTRISVTNGSRFETYELEVLEQENIETPLGVLVVLPVKQVRRPGSEGIELWLAVNYHYLPVKVRFIDREGNPSGEQLVSAIEVSAE